MDKTYLKAIYFRPKAKIKLALLRGSKYKYAWQQHKIKRMAFI
ncbi:MAG: hypothetical protein K0R80_2559 [Clostridia bacterium]|jgi:hypothetical protein|nr:hypothetical protein [Clostridia bacterium]